MKRYDVHEIRFNDQIEHNLQADLWTSKKTFIKKSLWNRVTWNKIKNKIRKVIRLT